MITSNAARPKKYPTNTMVTPHAHDPRIVYVKNFLMLIFNNPAGIEIISLNTGTILPNNTALSPYFSKLSEDSNFKYTKYNLEIYGFCKTCKNKNVFSKKK